MVRATPAVKRHGVLQGSGIEAIAVRSAYAMRMGKACASMHAVCNQTIQLIQLHTTMRRLSQPGEAVFRHFFWNCTSVNWQSQCPNVPGHGPGRGTRPTALMFAFSTRSGFTAEAPYALTTSVGPVSSLLPPVFWRTCPSG